MRRWMLPVLFLALAALSPSAGAAPADVEVMIVGTYHMANPGRDIHNAHADDVLAPRRQRELADVAAHLARFEPTRVAVEWPADLAATRYAAYLGGTLGESRNEVVQLGFRLAKLAGLREVDGLDVEGDFPYAAVETYAKAHGQQAILADANAQVEAFVRAMQAKIDADTVADVLRFLNDPARIARDNAFYRQMLRIGAGAQQPGVDLLTDWYKRNFAICANLVQRARAGDRVVVFYGAGHAFLLRQCVQEMPGYRLVEANGYLP
ncbi:DUF5694 domain-containing protein [Mizugakiibacter sediminis]|uniref:TraB/GumN family protein n=2 Tax=Mizugakiibacter sediminis TaxID=1475481 RepID=A0A0U1PBQ0_9GAMM|nr:DUF5694 domain-containing protein [Mizugakiibacter sediminis]